MNESDQTLRPAASERSPPYRPDIDGLRAVAVASVVLYHAEVPLLGGGFAGVDVFFVISGFLIGTIVFRGVGDGSFGFADFYARRARRILPALLVVALFTMAVGALLLSAAEFKETASSTFSALLGASNVHFLRSVDYFARSAELDPMLMTWSLGVEEQFYVVLPFVFIALRRFGQRFTLGVFAALTLASLALCIWLAAMMPTFAFYMLPTRAWELGVGVTLGIWTAIGGWRPAGRLADAISAGALLTLLLALCLLGASAGAPGLPTLAPVLATAALIATPGAALNRRLLGSRALVGTGLISYSWYLWHWPLIAFVNIAAVGQPVAGAKIAVAGLALCAAYFSWRYVEIPFRRATAASLPTVMRYGAVLAASAGAVMVVSLWQGFPARVPLAARQVEAVVTAFHNQRCLSGGTHPDILRCTRPSQGRNMVVAIGDSHAAALAPAIVEKARNRGQGWAILAKGSCRPLTGVTVFKASEPTFANDCTLYMREALAWARDNPAVRDVVLVGLWGGPVWNLDEHYVTTDGGAGRGDIALLGQGLENSVRLLRQAGKRVHVVQSPPYWAFDPVQAAMAEAIPARRWLASVVSEPGLSDGEFGRTRPLLPAIEQAIAGATRNGGGRYVKTRASFCDKAGCRYRRGNSLYYTDRSHLSPAGAANAFAAF